MGLSICSPDLVAHWSCKDGALGVPAVACGERDCRNGSSGGPDLLRRHGGGQRALDLEEGRDPAGVRSQTTLLPKIDFLRIGVLLFFFDFSCL